MADEERHIGIVKFYNPRKGYGFVTRPDGKDVFFHLTHFRTLATPSPGNVVRFVLGQNREGPTAEDIVIVPSSEVERYGGTITSLTDEGGVITTPDNFTILFRRSDYIPHTRADSLRAGDEVEMHFLVRDDDGNWRASVVRAPDFDPDSVTTRTERREGDEEEENRRLLGILYKTDLDEEADHAARMLAERNMRATLSALVSRVFDRRLSPETRLGLIVHMPQVYFDDECQQYLEQMAGLLAQAVREEDEEQSPAAVGTLQLLLDDESFPLRWSQYLLPFGLTLLRSLSLIPSCHSLLEANELDELADRWMVRVCRHVEQRRTGYGYVMTTALATFDELWQREALQPPVERALSRLLLALDSEGLANQIYHLRDKLSSPFLRLLVPALGQHPDLAGALRGPAQSEIFSHWVETLLESSDETLPIDMLATVLPVVEEIRAQAADEETITRLMRPLTDSLTAAEVVRMLTAEDLPERAVWACLRHLDHRGELSELLEDEEVRRLVTGWLRRATEQPGRAPRREQELDTALRLVESLKASEELRGELADIGNTLFSSIHDRVARADADELALLLDQFDLREMPGLAAVLARRLCDERFPEAGRRRVLAYFDELGPPFSDAAAALLRWLREPDDIATTSQLITAVEACGRSDDPEAHRLGQVAADRLSHDAIGWHDGFVAAVEELAGGDRAARIEGFAILLPERLFQDPADFAPNRYVRLLHRRGLATAVVGAPVPEAAQVCGRLSGALSVDERNAIVGTLVDFAGEPCYFEVANLRSGHDKPLQEGCLMRFTRIPAVGDQPFAHVAFNVDASFGPEQVPLLLDALLHADDEQVAVTAGRTAVDAAGPGQIELWRQSWSQVPAARAAAVEAELDEAGRQQLARLLGQS